MHLHKACRSCGGGGGGDSGGCGGGACTLINTKRSQTRGKTNEHQERFPCVQRLHTESHIPGNGPGWRVCSDGGSGGALHHGVSGAEGPPRHTTANSSC